MLCPDSDGACPVHWAPSAIKPHGLCHVVARRALCRLRTPGLSCCRHSRASGRKRPRAGASALEGPDCGAPANRDRQHRHHRFRHIREYRPKLQGSDPTALRRDTPPFGQTCRVQRWTPGQFIQPCSQPGSRGGRLQVVLMRHPPSYLSKLAGGGGGSAGGWGGGDWQLGRGGGVRNPLLSHAYLKGVSGGMGV